MSEEQRKPRTDPVGKPQPTPPESSGTQQAYVYRHAGISEREGSIPVWLMLVVIGLLIWSVYYTVRYTVRYWSAS